MACPKLRWVFENFNGAFSITSTLSYESQVEEDGQIKTFSPEEISAIILGKMKDIAETYLECEVKNAVITVPAHFSDALRQATKNAGTIAGLNVLRIINEPTAAAIAYGLDKKSVGEKNVLIFDLGGGTFDVSVLSIDDGIFEVKATCGDTRLGGEDFDNVLVKRFIEMFKQKYNKDLKRDKGALTLLRKSCEKAKRILSSELVATVAVEVDGADLEGTISRTEFESLCEPLFEKTLVPVEQALADAGLDSSEIADIVIVGGSTRIPRIRTILSDYFGGKQLNCSINPDEAIAYGAAVQASVLNGDQVVAHQDMLLLDVCPISLGIATAGGQMTTLIKRNTTIPTSEMKVFSTTVDGQTTVLVQVYEGESTLVRENSLLGRFQLSGFPAAPARVPQIEVTFEVDANGILKVSAVERNSGKGSAITIQSPDSYRLTPADVERMSSEAEVKRQQDKRFGEKRKAETQLRCCLDQFRQTIDSCQLPSKDRIAIANILDDTTQWLESSSAEVEVEELVQRQRDVELHCQPIIAKHFEVSEKASAPDLIDTEDVHQSSLTIEELSDEEEEM